MTHGSYPVYPRVSSGGIPAIESSTFKSYVIERDGGSWVLRLFGRQEAMISGPTLESAKEQAFEYVRQWAPCKIRVIGKAFEEWRLERVDGEWGEVEHV